MKLQALHCEIGDHDWSRPSQRGRPPRVCPECQGENAPAVQRAILNPLDPRLTRYLPSENAMSDVEEHRMLHFIATTLKTGKSAYGGAREDADIRILTERAEDILERMEPRSRTREEFV